MEKFYVYHLINSLDNQIFYVGKGKNKRIQYYEKAVAKGQIPNNNKLLFFKIKKLIRNGGYVVYKKTLTAVSENKAWEREKRDIKKLGRINNKTGILCNLTDGGEGSSGLVYSKKMREYRRTKMLGKSNPMFGKKHSLEVRKLISDARRSRKSYLHTEEHKNSLRIYNPGGVATSNPVYRFDLTGKFLDQWQSCRQASLEIFRNKHQARSIMRAAKLLQSYNNCFWILERDTGSLVRKETLKVEKFKIIVRTKKLIQRDEKGNIVKMWRSTREACKALNLNPPSISRASKNKSKFKNYFWEVVNA